MRLATKIPLVTALMVSITSLTVAGTALSISYSQGLDGLQQELSGFVSAVESEPDPLSAAIFLAGEKPFTLAYFQSDGTVTLLQEKAGPLESPSLISFELDLGFGESLRVGADTSALAKSVQDSIPMVALSTLLLVILSSLIAWLALRSDTRTLRQLSRSAQSALRSSDFQIPNASSSAELTELSDSLQDMLSRIEKSQQSLQDFLSDTSHELKTPLTVIRGYLELMQKTPDGPGREKAIAAALREALRMQRIVSGLLEMSAIDASKQSDVELFDPVAAINIELENLAVVQPERKISYQGPETAELIANPNLFSSLIGNVFSNIRTHTPKDASLEVKVAVDDSQLVIEVSDQGPGLSPELLLNKTALPVRFRTGTGTESSGLGLNIMHKAALSLGAELQISNRKTGGAQVRMVFPKPTAQDQ